MTSSWFARRITLIRSASKALRTKPAWAAWLFLIVALVWVAYWVGIRTKDPPTNLRSFGIVVQVQGRGALPGLDIPSGGCRVCASGTDVMRYNPGAGLRVDIVVNVHPTLFPPSCGAATVDMVISGTPQFWQQHDRLGPAGRLTRIAVGWDPHTHLRLPPGVAQPSIAHNAPALTVFYDDPQAPLHPGFYINQDLLRDSDPRHVNRHQTMVWPYPRAHPYGLWTQIYNWGYIPGVDGTRAYHQWPLHLHFLANWVAPRGWGSCYVLLPSFLANGAFAGTQDAIEALTQRPSITSPAAIKLLSEAQPPTAIRTALITSGSFSLSDTNPPPSDLEAIFFATHGTLRQRAGDLAARSAGSLGPVWACHPADDLSYLVGRGNKSIPTEGSFPGDACGAVAVVNAAGASDFRAVFLIILGVLIALAFERLFSAFHDALRNTPTVQATGTSDVGKSSSGPDTQS